MPPISWDPFAEPERFWEQVDRTQACWQWTGSRQHQGYGSVFFGGRRSRYMAHRLSWELVNGPIPRGLCVLHRCDNPPCVRPAHLFLGTRRDNYRDRDQKKRVQCGETSGKAVLAWRDVQEIRAEYARGGTTYFVLAQKYGVSFAQIGRIVRGDNWKRPRHRAATERSNQ